MERYLGRYAPQIYAILRIIAGLMFMMHGTQKLLNWPEPFKGPPILIMKVAGAIELVGGLLIAIGLFASFAAFIASGEMAVAFFTAHVMQKHSIIPLVNGGELAVLYCFVFLYIAAAGAGIWSVDAGRRRGRR